jgi:BirA family transcriptional regulator, biotin operon repressor / biotin---[acetyl-CoA-carboxylase] ligase
MLDPSFPFSIQLFDRLDSTNQTLWEQVDRGAVPGTVAIAREQTAGRGQWGRQWISSRGGLYLSAFWTPQISAARVVQLTMCSAWGIAIALREWGIPVRLKWLNDLVLEGRKLGGILTETRLRGGIVTQAVVGVGINWTNPVPETGINLQSFLNWEMGGDLDLDKLAAIVLRGLAMGWQRLQESGIETILSEYETLLINIGQSVRLPNSQGFGTIAGVEPNGDLRVCCNSETGETVCLPPGSLRLGYPIDANESKTR